MKVILKNHFATKSANIAIRCPHCGHFGTFEQLISDDIGVSGTFPLEHTLGIRRCPNTRCKGQLFFILHNSSNTLTIFPPDVIPFDKENVPTNVLVAFEEAIICHSNQCYIASAIMIRKTLEEICLEKGVSGHNLLKKLKELSSKILIPNELILGMDDLRLLGNDAAHIEAQTFKEIGQKEIEVSIDFTKEILKAVYQYDSLLKKLRDLKEKDNEA
jgi:hypothetical protein